MMSGEKASVIVTPNLPVGQWGTAFNGNDTLPGKIGRDITTIKHQVARTGQ